MARCFRWPPQVKNRFTATGHNESAFSTFFLAEEMQPDLSIKGNLFITLRQPISMLLTRTTWDDGLKPSAFEQTVALVAPDDLASRKAAYPCGEAEQILQRDQPEPPSRVPVIEQAQSQFIGHPQSRRRHRQQ